MTMEIVEMLEAYGWISVPDFVMLPDPIGCLSLPRWDFAAAGKNRNVLAYILT